MADLQPEEPCPDSLEPQISAEPQLLTSVFRLLFPGEQLDSEKAGLLATTLHALAAQASLMSEDDNNVHQAKRRGKQRELDFSRYNTRYVALHVFYCGWDYHGFASQGPKPIQTIEGTLFEAMRHTCLIPKDSTWQSVRYSRGGRTDKGVSAFRQVIALNLRSKAAAGQPLCPTEEEVDYALILNRALPEAIRVLGWADVKPDFHARFGADSREYKYFILRDAELQVEAMQQAVLHLHGEHDFRNFCKVDASHPAGSFKRTIYHASIEPAEGDHHGAPAQMLVLHIRGSAFLWHQVRCMVAVLLLVGQGLESPDVVATMLDLQQTPAKPQYLLASEEPLLLQSVHFDGLELACSASSHAHTMRCIQGAHARYAVRAAMLWSALDSLQGTPIRAGKQSQKRPEKHVPLRLRAKEPLLSERTRRERGVQLLNQAQHADTEVEFMSS